MPAATCRIYPARSRRRWLGTSASAGSSRNVGIKSLLQSMISEVIHGIVRLLSERKTHHTAVWPRARFILQGMVFAASRRIVPLLAFFVFRAALDAQPAPTGDVELSLRKLNELGTVLMLS